jgi:hypothetical protein
MFFLDSFLKIENHARGLSYRWGRIISGQIGNYMFVVMGLSVETNSPLITQEIPLILWKMELIFTFQRACNQNVPTTFHPPHYT